MGLAERFAREDAEAAFLTFWNIWRKHMRKTDGRGKARPAFQQMIEAGADPQDIIDGANWYLSNMTERDAPYIPLAASWLRSERWADDCEQARSYQKRLEEARARQGAHAAPTDRTNVVNLQQPDNRPSEEERTRFAQGLLARAGLAAQG